jgi:hypothetical protein
MTIRSALLMIGIWVILAFSTVHSFQATLLRRSDNTDTHTALLIKTAHRMSAIDLAILLLLGGLRALLVRQRRRYERRIDLDARWPRPSSSGGPGPHASASLCAATSRTPPAYDCGETPQRDDTARAF